MALPVAHIGHRTADRVRIKIPSRRGDGVYFAQIGEVLSKHTLVERVELNPVTGSVLLKGVQARTETIAAVAKKHALFELETRPGKIVPLTERMATPVHDVNHAIERFSGGELNLRGMAILTLLGAGLYQLLRGDFRALPWHVAFWYALGIFAMGTWEKKE